MSINWNEGMMRWMPYVDADGKTYSLSHLHPFRYSLIVNHMGHQVEVEIRVVFAMHCFTRAPRDGDIETQFYRDTRETRTFCPGRYSLSTRLPAIARELATRKCSYAKNENYVTVDVQTGDTTVRYGVFFNVMRVKDAEGLAVLLTIQSAYELSFTKQLPGRGSIRFTRLIELTLEGIKPKPPR